MVRDALRKDWRLRASNAVIAVISRLTKPKAIIGNTMLKLLVTDQQYFKPKVNVCELTIRLWRHSWRM